MIKYGLISKVDASVLERTIDNIIEKFPSDDHLHITEIGLFDGGTARGIREYVFSKGKGICYTGVDNEKDKPILRPFPMANLIIGNSCEVYNRIENNSQHLVFFDGNHSFPAVVQDFFCYASKIKIGGYAAFHDTAKHISEYKDWQRMGDARDRDMYISVRKALREIGLLEAVGHVSHFHNHSWQLIYDEEDQCDEAGGMCVFQKLNP